MHKEEKLELLKFCLSWNKPLSDEFICSYCEFPSANAFHCFAVKNKVNYKR